jgi:sugar phosphate isomerase/epimerase
LRVYVTVWFRDFSRAGLASELGTGGFDGVELSLDYPLCREGLQDPAVEGLRGLGLELAVHLPWREVHLASPIEEVRATSLRYVVECLRSSARLEPRYAVLHVTTDQAVCSSDTGLCLSRAVESVRQVAGVAEEYGIPLYVETTRQYCCGGLEHAAHYVELGVGICLDVPHAVERYSRLRRRLLTLGEVLREAPPSVLPHIEVVHLHGYTVSGYYVVDSHIEPTRELLSEYLGLVRSGTVKPSTTVLESFFSQSGGRLTFDRLRWCVDEIRRACSRGGRGR